MSLVSSEHRLGTEVAKQAHRAQSHLAPAIVAGVQSSALVIQLAGILEDRELVGGDTELQGHLGGLVRLASTHEAPLILAINKRPLPPQTLQARKTRELRPQYFEVTTIREGRVLADHSRSAIAHEALAIGNRERHPSCSHSTSAGCASQPSVGPEGRVH